MKNLTNILLMLVSFIAFMLNVQSVFAQSNLSCGQPVVVFSKHAHVPLDSRARNYLFYRTTQTGSVVESYDAGPDLIFGNRDDLGFRTLVNYSFYYAVSGASFDETGRFIAVVVNRFDVLSQEVHFFDLGPNGIVGGAGVVGPCTIFKKEFTNTQVTLNNSRVSLRNGYLAFWYSELTQVPFNFSTSVFSAPTIAAAGGRCSAMPVTGTKLTVGSLPGSLFPLSIFPTVVPGVVTLSTIDFSNREMDTLLAHPSLNVVRPWRASPFTYETVVDSVGAFNLTDVGGVVHLEDSFNFTNFSIPVFAPVNQYSVIATSSVSQIPNRRGSTLMAALEFEYLSRLSTKPESLRYRIRAIDPFYQLSSTEFTCPRSMYCGQPFVHGSNVLYPSAPKPAVNNQQLNAVSCE